MQRRLKKVVIVAESITVEIAVDLIIIVDQVEIDVDPIKNKDLE